MTKFEMAYQFVQVLREGVVVVARGRLAGFAEPAPVVSDDAVPRRQQGRYLFLPGSAAERIAVNEHDRLARAMVFVVQVNVA